MSRGLGDVYKRQRQDQRDRGEIRWLDHGEAREYDLTFSALAGEAALDALADRVKAALG